jgi:hypothetical protein
LGTCYNCGWMQKFGFSRTVWCAKGILDKDISVMTEAKNCEVWVHK